MTILGRSYIADCVIAAYNQRIQREGFEIYLTDVAAALVNMFAKDTQYPRYYDLMHPAQEDSRTGTEIAEDIIARYGLTVVRDNGLNESAD